MSVATRSAAAAPSGGVPPPPPGGGGRKKRQPADKVSPPPPKRHKAKKGFPRDRRCKPCVRRLALDPDHECCDQAGRGVACYDCAKTGHTTAYRPYSDDPKIEASINKFKTAARTKNPRPGTEAWTEISNEAVRRVDEAGRRERPGTPVSTAGAALSRGQIAAFLNVITRIANAVEELHNLLNDRIRIAPAA